MNELPKELTPELLGLVLEDVMIGAITEVKPYSPNSIVYTTYELPTIKYKILNLDTLTRLMKEWCLDESFCLMSFKDFDGTWFCNISVNCNSFQGQTAFEAVSKATHWVAKEKGLIK